MDTNIEPFYDEPDLAEWPAQEEAVAAPIACPDMAPLFAAGGPVQRLLGDRYRPRPGQVHMAQQIATLLRQPGHALIEAGTGIGKSFAYLIPAIWSGTPAVVSTSNKALMAQLWHKDVPALQQIAPRSIKAVLLKGRSNYLCALRMRDLSPRQRKLSGFGGDLERVQQGLARVPSGDVEEMGLPSSMAANLTVDFRGCEGRKCPEFGSCFFERARAAAQKADLVITNHAVLCFSALQQANVALPVRPLLIIDEAHELPTYAITALSQSLEYETLPSLVNHPMAKEVADNELRRQAAEFNQAFFAALSKQRPGRYASRWALQGEIQEGLRLFDALSTISKKLNSYQPARDAEGQFEALQRQAAEAVVTVRALSTPEPEAAIRICELADERGGEIGGLKLTYRPLEVQARLQSDLFEEWPRVVCTSATLALGSDLSWFQRNVGAISEKRPTALVRIPSPFDYKSHVLIYTPPGLVPLYEGAAEERYLGKLAAEVRRLVEASRGRAFVLCTSKRRATQLYEAVAPGLPYLCLSQDGKTSRRELLERFQADGRAVLFATRSFWEGVDVPGDALSLVILDKIPFLPQDDPVLKRQEKLIADRQGNPFNELQLSHAILTLRQGAGRLVRTEDDRGVIALLDSRILEKSYGQKILAALPDGRPTRRFEDVAAFFAGA
ncbi:MAG: ATP-dependent DNA helicase [Nitrososphaerales archaeon]